MFVTQSFHGCHIRDCALGGRVASSPLEPAEDSIMKTKSKKEHNGKSNISVEALVARAAAVEKLAAAAKKQLRLVKAEHKAARKAVKQAKKAARRARKEAKLAMKAGKANSKKASKRVKARISSGKLIASRATEAQAAPLHVVAKKPAPGLMPPAAIVPPESRTSS